MKKDSKQRIEFEELNDKTQEVLTEIKETLMLFAFAFIFALAIVRFVAVRTIVDGNSMNDLLYNNDNVLLEKVSYTFHEPERFDIVVFKLDDGTDTNYIKRIIGLPGETVQIIDGYVYINGEKLSADVYGKDVMNNAYNATYPITLSEDEYFVLGDNRNNSKDSRFTNPGPIHRSQFLGKAFVRFYPLSSFLYLGNK